MVAPCLEARRLRAPTMCSGDVQLYLALGQRYVRPFLSDDARLSGAPRQLGPRA